MNKLSNYIFLILVSLLSFHISAETLYSKTEVMTLEKELIQKIEKNLSSYLQGINFSVFIELNKKEKKVNHSNYGLSLFQSVGASEKMFTVQGVKARVYVYEELGQYLDEDIKKIITDSLSSYTNYSTEVSYLESTKIYSQQLEEQRNLAIGFFNRLVKNHLPHLINFAGILVFSAAVVIVVYIFAKLIKIPLMNLVDSIKALAGRDMKSQTTDEDALENTLETNKYEKQESEGLILIFKQLLESSPENFLKEVLSTRESRSGFRRVLPMIYDKSVIDLVRTKISSTDLKKIEEESWTFESDGVFQEWIKSFVERMAVNSINTPWTILDGISNEVLRRLKLIKVKSFLSYLNINKNKISVSIFLTIVEGEEKELFLKSMSINDWRELSMTDVISLKDVEEEVFKILDYVDEGLSGESTLSVDEIQKKILLPSILLVLPNKKLGEQDDFLFSFADSSLEIISEVEKKIFTPNVILRIPLEVLTESFRQFDVETIGKAICSFKANVKEYLVRAIPDGNLVKILTSKINNDNYTDDEKERAGKAFLCHLFELHKNKRFSLHTNISKIQLVKNEEDLNVDDLDFNFDDINSETDAA